MKTEHIWQLKKGLTDNQSWDPFIFQMFMKRDSVQKKMNLDFLEDF